MSKKIDCDTTAPALLTVEEARQRLLDAIVPVEGSQRLPIRDALERVLAETVTSPIDVPGHANSAMDGYAVKAGDLAAESNELAVVGTAFAGHPWDGTLQPGQAVRIMTGAVVPAGADTVIMQEQAERDGDVIRVGNDHKQGANVRFPGEDLERGGEVFGAGQRLGPAELGMLASLGIAEVTVRRRPKVAFFSTGDELRPVGESLAEGQIYDSNRYTLHGVLSQSNVEFIDMGVIPDDRNAIEQAFEKASNEADAVITSGGVSVGEADYVKETLDKIGEVNFWKIAMKPGKPLAFGRIGKAWFFGLPGNPVSALATWLQMVRPAIARLSGRPPVPFHRFLVPTATPLKKAVGRTDFQRGILEYDADGRLMVRSTGMQGSHMLSSMSRANCFIVLPAEGGSVDAGTMVEVEPFTGVFDPA